MHSPTSTLRSDHNTKAAPRRRVRYRPALERCEGRTLLTTYTVTALTDSGVGHGTSGDLRYCIGQANADGQRDTIEFAVTGTLSLGSPLPALVSGRGVTIAGPGADALTIRGGGSGDPFTILRVKEGASATISGLSFADGSAPELGGAILDGGNLKINGVTFVGNSARLNGGAIYVTTTGTLSIADTTLVGNSAGVSGGAIYSLGPVTITRSMFVGNRAESSGGGIEETFALTRITGSTFANNSTGLFGGAISINGPRDLTNRPGDLTLTDSTLSGNMAGRADGGGFGGGIASNDSQVRILGTSITGNAANRLAGGVGINGGNLTLTNSTFTNNRSAGSGGGLAINGGKSITGLNVTEGATLAATNATFTGNTAHGSGGAIASVLTTSKIDHSAFTANTAGALGGGIALDADEIYQVTKGKLTLTDSTVSNNTAGRYGGGVGNFFDTLVLDNATITANRAGTSGGGVFNSRILHVGNSTVTANRPDNFAGTSN